MLCQRHAFFIIGQFQLIDISSGIMQYGCQVLYRQGCMLTSSTTTSRVGKTMRNFRYPSSYICWRPATGQPRWQWCRVVMQCLLLRYRWSSSTVSKYWVWWPYSQTFDPPWTHSSISLSASLHWCWCCMHFGFCNVACKTFYRHLSATAYLLIRHAIGHEQVLISA